MEAAILGKHCTWQWDRLMGSHGSWVLAHLLQGDGLCCLLHKSTWAGGKAMQGTLADEHLIFVTAQVQSTALMSPINK